MIRLIQFEMKKVFTSNLFRILLLAFCVFIIAYYIFVHINTVKVEELISEKESDIHRNQIATQRIKDSIESSDSNSKKGLESDLEFQEEWNEKDEITLKAFQENDWITLLNQDMERDEDSLARVRRDEYYTSSWPTPFTTEIRLAEYRWLLEREIAPVLRYNFWSHMTAYDLHFPIEGGSEDELKAMVVKFSDKYSPTGVYYLNHLFRLLFGVSGAILFLFLFGDIVTKEGLGRNGPIHLLQTQPIRRDKVLLSKFLTVLLSSVLILVGTSVFSIIFGTVFDSFGYWNYPVLIYGEEYSYSFMNMSTFILKSAFLFFMILLFCYSILFLFSILTKRASIALGLTIATIIMGIKLNEESVLSSLAPYIPFHYFSVPQVVTMELAVLLKNSDFSYMNGLISLGVSSFIILVVTYFVSVMQYKYGR